MGELLNFKIGSKDINKVHGFEGKIPDEYTENDIGCCLNISKKSDKCTACGCGYIHSCVLRMKDGNILYLKHESGCMTYSPRDSGYIGRNEDDLLEKYEKDLMDNVEWEACISENLDQMIKMGMTRNDRLFLKEFIIRIKDRVKYRDYVIF
uniref:Uncharacterized protein n=1 Tax=Pithovirus LCPAC101 TaxID=2506586 RepID=A0A481Z426_9VIRU|nr:MAG: hypothetical protein LCPAC101_00220 [Pithovirus LCPAC101]